MKIDMYVDVFDRNGFESYGLTATSRPVGKPYGCQRFKFTVNIPDSAFDGEVKYAPVEGDVVEVDKD